jgi:hypothetical protein
MKIALSVLFITLLVALVLIVLAQQGLLGKKALAPQPAATTSQSQTGAAVAPSIDAQKQTGDGQATSDTATLPASSYVSEEEAQKQAKAIADQVNAGTLSPEDATEQMNAIDDAPPALPPR